MLHTVIETALEVNRALDFYFVGDRMRAWILKKRGDEEASGHGRI
jgi:hypothetical protein